MNAKAETPPESSAQAEHDAHLARRSMRVRVVRDVFEIIAFSAAGIWALWTFWYQASYEPSHEVPRVEWTVTVTKEAVRASDGMLAIRVHATGVNKGKATLHLVSLDVTISGGHVLRTPERQPAEAIDPDAGFWQRELGARRRDKIPLASEGARWGGDNHASIDPDQEHTEDLLFWIDPADYDFLSAGLIVRSARKQDFDRGWYATRLDDAGIVSVEPTDACIAARPRCYRGYYDSEVELPLWPGAAPASTTTSPRADGGVQ